MKLLNLSTQMAALLLLAGCQTINANDDQPAVVVQPSDASRAALKQALSTIFGGEKITLADDALTRSSMLTLENNPPESADSEAALGRVVTRPYSFQLIKNQQGCFLVDLRVGQRHLLANTTCAPE
jgi:uncharacterized lipoprotein YbaY